MDRKGANEVLKELKRRYPSKYPANMDGETATGIVNDLLRNFVQYDTTDVIEGLAVWSDSNKFAPLMKEWELVIRSVKKKFSEISEEEFNIPTTWSKYIEDNDGCGYAINSKTGEYDCIWKYWWAEKGMDKVKVLKEHGIFNYG